MLVRSQAPYMDNRFSIAEFIARAPNAETRISYQISFVASYPEYVELLHDAIDLILDKMQRNPQLHINRTEDELSISLVEKLRLMGFDAQHDITFGGHCDIVVYWRDFGVWLAEAKKFTGSYDWLLKGFEQLDSRYSTAAPNQNIGSILVYVFTANLAGVMSNWNTYLLRERSDVKSVQCLKDPTGFISTHRSKRSGGTLTIRHKPVSIYFKPQDRIRKSSRGNL